MKKKEIIKNLKLLKELQPDKEFSDLSKRLLLNYFIKNKSIQEFQESEELVSLKETPSSILLLIKKIVVSLSFTATVLVIIGGIFYLTREISPIFLPGLNESKIRAEAEVINNQINIKISQLEKFKETISQENKILQQTTTNQLDHLNEIVLFKEKESTDFPSSQNLLEKTKELNQILEVLTKEE